MHCNNPSKEDFESEEWVSFLETINEGDGSHWKELQKKREDKIANYEPDTWDFSLAALNGKFVYKNIPIGDKEFQSQLNAENPEACVHKITNSSCLCGKASIVKNCSKCRTILCPGCLPGNCPNTMAGRGRGIMPKENGGIWPSNGNAAPEYPHRPPFNVMPPPMWNTMQMTVQRLPRDPLTFSNHAGFIQQMHYNCTNSYQFRPHIPLVPNPSQVQPSPPSASHCQYSSTAPKVKLRTKKPKNKPVANRTDSLEQPSIKVDDRVTGGNDDNVDNLQRYKEVLPNLTTVKVQIDKMLPLEVNAKQCAAKALWDELSDIIGRSTDESDKPADLKVQIDKESPIEVNAKQCAAKASWDELSIDIIGRITDESDKPADLKVQIDKESPIEVNAKQCAPKASCDELSDITRSTDESEKPADVKVANLDSFPKTDEILLNSEDFNKSVPTNILEKESLTHDSKAAVKIVHGIPLTPLKFGMGNRRKPAISSTILEEQQKVTKLTDLKIFKSANEIVASKEAVLITHFYSFDTVHIIPLAAFNWNLKLLKEDIYEMIECDEAKLFNFTPDVGTIVLAPYKNKKQEYFLRAVVEEVFSPFIVIRFFDIGSRDRVRVGSVFQMPEGLMTFPILGMEVTLKDIETSKTDLILMSDFHNFVKNWPEERECFLNSTENVGGREIVDLKCHDLKGCNRVSSEVINLGRWNWQYKWERVPGMTEAKLCSDTFWKVDELHIRKLNEGQRTKVTIVSCNPSTAEIAVNFNVETEPYFRDREVLQRQIELFIKLTGSKDDLFPTLGEHVLAKILPNDDKYLSSVKGIGKWNRCVRDGKLLIGLDELETYPITSDLKDIVKIRKYCPNFAKVPFFASTVLMKDCMPMDEKKAAAIKEFAQPGKVITIWTSAPDDDENYVYCEELFDRLTELGLADMAD